MVAISTGFLVVAAPVSMAESGMHRRILGTGGCAQTLGAIWGWRAATRRGCVFEQDICGEEQCIFVLEGRCMSTPSEQFVPSSSGCQTRSQRCTCLIGQRLGCGVSVPLGPSLHHSQSRPPPRSSHTSCPHRRVFVAIGLQRHKGGHAPKPRERRWA